MEQKKYINESWADSNGKRWEDYDTITCPDGQIIDMCKLLDEQNRAKAALLHIMPWFGAFVNMLRPVYTFKVKTQATDGKNLLINPQFTYNLDLTGKVFVMAHEIMHCVLNHLRRAKTLGHPMDKANIAADYECNCFVVDSDLVDASTINKIGGLYNSKYSGWGYEKIYADNPSGPKDPMDNKGESKDAQKQQDKQNGGGGQSGKQQFSADYKAGWNQAMEDFKKGKIKL